MPKYNMPYGKYPVTQWSPPTTASAFDVQPAEPDQPVYANELAYRVGVPIQSSDQSIPEPPAEATTAPGAGSVPTMPGVDVDGGVNAERIRQLANSLYPLGNTPQMVYGEDVNIPLPFTKKKIHIGGERMDRLASAIAAAAGNAYVPGSDTGGQFLKGFLQGYSGIRSKDYATRKAEYEKRVAEAKAQKEARDKFLAQLGVAGYTASMKPKAEEKPSTMVKVTRQLIDQARAQGINVPDGLEGAYINTSELIKKPGGESPIALANLGVSRANMALNESGRWTSSKTFEDYTKLTSAYQKISDIVQQAQRNPTDTKALENLINNMMDPTSATLLSEAARWSGQQGWYQDLKTIFTKIQGGGTMDAKTINDIKRLSDSIYGAGRAFFKSQRAQAIANGSAYGVPETVYRDIDDVTTFTKKPPGSKTTRSEEIP